METIIKDLHPRQKIGKYTVKNKNVGGITKKVSYILTYKFKKKLFSFYCKF